MRSRRELALEMREDGMTYKQIAEALGCSKSYVGQLVGAFNPYHFRAVTEEGCIYPGLREWMNDNKVSRSEMLRRMGKIAWPPSVGTMSNVMRGLHDPTKSVIDGILKVTGMTYEECFGGAENA